VHDTYFGAERLTETGFCGIQIQLYESALSEIEDESVLDTTLAELSNLSRKDLMMTVSRAAGKESHRKRLLKRIELLEKDLEEARQELASLDKTG
jgi:hypothetical protein